MAGPQLVICEVCHRPQFAAQNICIVCGATLPAEPAPQAQSARDRLIESYQPFFEGDFGGGHVLLLSQRDLQWRTPRQRDAFRLELPAIARVELRRRPMWESLLIPLASVWVWFTPSRWLVWAWCAVAVWGIAACLLQRRYALHLTLKDGRHRQIDLDFGRETTAAVQRIRSIWDSLVTELSALSVEARPR
jgi:hypothetical protein